jgi:drug/metabolite transporter (DMT)-like permease
MTAIPFSRPAVRLAPRAGAVAALAAAGVAWGTSVPLSKAALGWLGPEWLTAARFSLAALILLTALCRTGTGRAAVRAACRWRVLAWGAVGLGGAVMIANTGLARTSVTHAALLAGTAPILVALIVAAWRRDVARPVAWAGFALSLAGTGFIAGGKGGGATAGGDALVVVSTLLIAATTVAQDRMLRGQDPVAMTAVQFLGAAIAAVSVAACMQGLPPLRGAASYSAASYSAASYSAASYSAASNSAGLPSGTAALAVLALTVVGTVVPFTLFASGQRHVSTKVAGAFLNLEPLVGVLIGIIAFGDPVGPRQLLGGAAVLGGILLSSLPPSGKPRSRRSSGRPGTSSRIVAPPSSPGSPPGEKPSSASQPIHAPVRSLEVLSDPGRVVFILLYCRLASGYLPDDSEG